jgi:hypothetical protein
VVGGLREAQRVHRVAQVRDAQLHGVAVIVAQSPDHAVQELEHVPRSAEVRGVDLVGAVREGGFEVLDLAEGPGDGEVF